MKRRKKDKKRNLLKVFIRILFIAMGLIVLLYSVILGLAWYQQKHPGQVDFEKLRRKMTTSASTVTKGGNLTRELQELLERNEETRDFVENYGNRENYLGMNIDLSGDVEEGKVPLLMQWDKRWGYESFGNSNIGLAGCGPTCLSIAYIYFTGDLQGNPREIAGFCESKGYYTDQGTSWDFWTYGVEAFGLNGKELSLDETQMKTALDSGALIVCSMRPGDFTTTGHYILIVGYEEEGFCINDPNRRSNSERLWDYDTLKGQIRNLWRIGR